MPTKKKEAAHRVALDTRKFEIELFWKRAYFFLGFILSAFGTYGLGQKYQIENLVTLSICFGVVASAAWAMANRGSKYWQENWEQVVSDIEDGVTGPLFKNIKPVQSKGIWSAHRFSVSKMAIALSDYVSFIWLALLVNHIVDIKINVKWILIVSAILWVLLMATYGRSTKEAS